MPAISVHSQVMPLTLEAVRQAKEGRIWGGVEESNSSGSSAFRYQSLFFPHDWRWNSKHLFFHPELARLQSKLKCEGGYAGIIVVTIAPDGEHLRFQGSDQDGNSVEKYGFVDVAPAVVQTVAVENVIDAARFLVRSPQCMASNCTGAKGKALELHRSVVFSLTGTYDHLQAFCGNCFDLEYGEPGKLDPDNVLLDGRGLYLHSPVTVFKR